ncbi:heterokaryon incompatibility protein-domain-containing protein, partial [Massariosphaeria phaeospora]
MSTSPYAVEKVKADAFDFTQAQRWMSLCDRTHANCRVRAGSRKIVRLTVFDCHNQTLVAHDANQPYLALSYVWGPQPETKATSGDYPRVIEDAIRATQKLGYRFLWIDRYCINQTNKEEQKAQLQQMDLIYENADLTIVAAAGQNDQYGLPGIGTRADTQAKRPPQPAATIGNLQLVSSLPDIELYLSESKWSTRGWTYQEALLSRRCLMFFTSQVYFVC